MQMKRAGLFVHLLGMTMWPMTAVAGQLPPLVFANYVHVESTGYATVFGGDVRMSNTFGFVIDRINQNGFDSAAVALTDPSGQPHSATAGCGAQPSLTMLTEHFGVMGTTTSLSGGASTGPWNHGPPRNEWDFATSVAEAGGAGMMSFVVTRRAAIVFNTFSVSAGAKVLYTVGSASGSASLAFSGSDRVLALIEAGATAVAPTKDIVNQKDLNGQVHVVDPGLYEVAWTVSADAVGTASLNTFVSASAEGHAVTALYIVECQSITNQPRSVSADLG